MRHPANAGFDTPPEQNEINFEAKEAETYICYLRKSAV
jgi:hypothetical protein